MMTHLHRIIHVPVLAVLTATAGCYGSHETLRPPPRPDASTDPVDTADPPSEPDAPVDRDAEPPACPHDMVDVEGRFCIDRWEASRPDATETTMGTDTSLAISEPGKMPWMTGSSEDDYATVRAACAAAGKRLCRPDEWFQACTGPDDLTYCYGDEYEPLTCNGIDAFCMDVYPGCGLDERNFHVAATGSFSGCTNEYGLLDVNGNLWEWVQDPDLSVRGGAFNCGNSALLHQCDYVSAAAVRSAIGFRCCL
jgi:hypothetical protein